ncbi:MAG: hypothetical protein AAFX81_10375 [Pseudomonadota bacterium]
MSLSHPLASRPPIDPGYTVRPVKAWGEDGFGFDDLLDIVNPLQHLPVVGSVYRARTDDEIGAIPRLLGGTLFGGVLGAVSAAVNLVVQAATGRDLGDIVTAAFMGEPQPVLGLEKPVREWRMAKPCLTPEACAAARYEGVSAWLIGAARNDSLIAEV